MAIKFKLKDSHPANRIQIHIPHSSFRGLTVFKKIWSELPRDIFELLGADTHQAFDIKNYEKPKEKVINIQNDNIELKDMSKDELLKWCKKNHPELKIKDTLSKSEIFSILNL